MQKPVGKSYAKTISKSYAEPLTNSMSKRYAEPYAESTFPWIKNTINYNNIFGSAKPLTFSKGGYIC